MTNDSNNNDIDQLTKQFIKFFAQHFLFKTAI